MSSYLPSHTDGHNEGGEIPPTLRECEAQRLVSKALRKVGTENLSPAMCRLSTLINEQRDNVRSNITEIVLQSQNVLLQFSRLMKRAGYNFRDLEPCDDHVLEGLYIPR